MPTFYELSESKIQEAGFDNRAEFLSPALVSFVEGIIDDVRAQGGDPDMVVNWVTAARHLPKLRKGALGGRFSRLERPGAV